MLDQYLILTWTFEGDVLAEGSTNQENLTDLMRWALSRREYFIPTVIANVIVQDEFTHDVIVPWREGLVLVYDTT